MSKDLIIAFLALLSIGSLAAVFVLWAKLDEQKKLTKEEREKRWQETSIMLSNEKELNEKIQKQYEYAGILVKEYSRLQSKLSAILCPTNNHVWKDGECVKCGRVNNAPHE